MKCYITDEEWSKLDKLLMAMEIPYSVSFDSHINDDGKYVVYGKNITISSICIQTKVWRREEE